jgi:hypothetical protein
MDLLQAQALIEQALNYIQAQGPDGLERLSEILLALKAGAVAIWGVSTIIAKWPILLEGINQLLILIQSGATIAEIAAQLAAWVQTVSVSVDVLLQLLYALAGALALF